MVTHRQECPLEVIECKYYNIGCRNTMARKDWCNHEKEKMEEHLHLTSNRLTECETKIGELESEIKQNKSLLKLLFGEWAVQLNTRTLQSSAGDQVLPVIIRMPEYTGKFVLWYSDPFYTKEKGYKLQLKVAKNMQYLSVCLCLMKGPYDNKLSWPLTGKYEVRLLNQTSDESHHSRTASIYNANMIVSDDDSSPPSCKAVAYGTVKEVWRESRFIKIASTMSPQYLKNGSLIFEVSKDKGFYWLDMCSDEEDY